MTNKRIFNRRSDESKNTISELCISSHTSSSIRYSHLSVSIYDISNYMYVRMIIYLSISGINSVLFALFSIILTLKVIDSRHVSINVLTLKKQSLFYEDNITPCKGDYEC